MPAATSLAVASPNSLGGETIATIAPSLISSEFGNAIYDPIKTLYKDYDLIALILQSIHGIVMLIAPVSVILVAGLKYLNISYKEWLKNVWKYLLLAFISIVIVIALMALL